MWYNKYNELSFYDNVKIIGDRQKKKLENMGSGETIK